MKIFLALLVLTMPVMAVEDVCNPELETGSLDLCLEQLVQQNKEQQKRIQELELRNGLIAHYPFDGNANDVSGNGNHGEVHGATFTKDRFGNADSAYSFDNAYIQTKHQISINKWNHIVGVWRKNGSNINVKMYVNSKLVGKNTSGLMIGKDTYSIIGMNS